MSLLHCIAIGKMNIVQRQIIGLLTLAMLLVVGLAGCSKDQLNTQADINAQKVKDDAVITKYLAANNVKAAEVDSSGVPTGIYYVADTLGTDSTLYTSSTLITVGYTCQQLTVNATLGPIVQTTDQFHPSYTLGSVLSGWLLAFEDIPVGMAPGAGGEITLYLPSAYAYGPYAQATLGLPANAILVFHINVYNVTN
jgi:FKBP-type peptidyl-prolyl cis-trans isomerase FkpA